PRAREHVGERVPCHSHRQHLPPPRRHTHIQINRVRRDAFDRPRLAPKLPAHHAHLRPVVISNLGNLHGFHFLVTRRRHLQRRGQVRPQLKPVHAPGGVALGHLLGDDPPARRPPPDLARGNRSPPPPAGPLLRRSRKYTPNRLHSPLRLPPNAHP